MYVPQHGLVFTIPSDNALFPLLPGQLVLVDYPVRDRETGLRVHTHQKYTYIHTNTNCYTTNSEFPQVAIVCVSPLGQQSLVGQETRLVDLGVVITILRLDLQMQVRIDKHSSQGTVTLMTTLSCN